MDTPKTADDNSSQVSKASKPLGQVLCFVSAKGGTGKTVLSAVTAYTLLQSGMRVVTIDTDFSTRGLSLFLLGSVLDSYELQIQSKHCLADSILEEISVDDVTPLTIVRGSIEYNVVISNKDVWRGGVPDERFLGGSPWPTERNASPTEYFKYLRQLCERLRKDYDYVIIDTRGGYDFTSAAPATIADGYVVIVEADRVSIEQVSGFKKKIDEYASSSEHFSDIRPAVLKGFIVNKALFSVDDNVFPEALAREYNSKTFGVIPADRDVIRAYQKKDIPQEKFPDSDFSYFSLQTTERLISPEYNWPTGNADRFYKFFSRIRSQWTARKRTEFFQQALTPILLIVFAVSSAIFYLFFKRNFAGYSLPAFYVASALFVLLAAIGAMFSTLSFMRQKQATPFRRKLVAVVFGVLLFGLFYLTAIDVPRTFSQGPLLQRIRDRDQTIASQDEKINELSRQASDANTESQFLRADRDQATKNLVECQNQMNDLQNQIANLKTQAANIKRDRDSAQSALSSSQQEAQNLRVGLADCQRKCR
jgi:cellulose biosynthesis protein BcsQ